MFHCFDISDMVHTVPQRTTRDSQEMRGPQRPGFKKLSLRRTNSKRPAVHVIRISISLRTSRQLHYRLEGGRAGHVTLRSQEDSLGPARQSRMRFLYV